MNIIAEPSSVNLPFRLKLEVTYQKTERIYFKDEHPLM